MTRRQPNPPADGSETSADGAGAAPGGGPRSPRRRRWARWILLGLLLAAGLGFVTRERWLWPAVQRRVVTQSDGELGPRLSLHGLGESGTGWLHADGLELELGRRDRPWLQLAARRAEVAEADAALLLGRASGVRRLRLDEPELRLDLGARAASESPRASAPFDARTLPGIVAAGLRFELRLGRGRTLRIAEARLVLDDAAVRPRRIALEGRLELERAQPASAPPAVLALRLEGVVGTTSIEQLRVSLDGARLLEAGQLSWASGVELRASPAGFGPRSRIALEAGRGRVGFELRLVQRAGTGGASTNGAVRAVPVALQRLGRALGLAAIDPKHWTLRGGELTWTGEFDPADPLALRSRLRVELEGLRAGGVFALPRMRLSAASAAGRLTVRELRASDGAGATLDLRADPLELAELLEARADPTRLLQSAAGVLELRAEDLAASAGRVLERAPEAFPTGTLRATLPFGAGLARIEELDLQLPGARLSSEQLELRPGDADSDGWRDLHPRGALNCAVDDAAALLDSWTTWAAAWEARGESEPSGYLGLEGRLSERVRAALRGGGRARLEFGGRLGDPTLALDADHAGPNGSARLVAGWSDARLELERLELISANLELSASGALTALLWAQPLEASRAQLPEAPRTRLQNVRLRLRSDDLAALDPRLPAGFGALELAADGPLRTPLLEASATFAPIDRAPLGLAPGSELRLEVRSLAGPPGASPAAVGWPLDVELRARSASGERIELDGLASVERSDSPHYGLLHLLRGRWNPGGGGPARLALRSPARLAWARDGALALDQFSAAGTLGSLQLDARAAAPLGRSPLAFALLAERIDLGFAGASGGALGGALASGGLWTLEGAGALDPQSRRGSARIEALLGGAPTLIAGAASGGRVALRLEDDRLHLDAQEARLGGFGSLEGAASVRLGSDGGLFEPRGALQFEAALGRESVERWVAPRLGPGSAELAGTLTGLRASGRAALEGGLRLEGLRIEQPASGLDLTGSFELGAFDPQLDLSSVTRAELRELPLDLNAAGRVERLEHFGRWWRSSQQLAGRIELESLHASGTAAAPELSGRMRLEQGALTLRAAGLPTLDELEAELSFAGSALQIERASGLWAAAPLELRGAIDLKDGPQQLDLSFTGAGLALARASDLRLRGDADLTLTGRFDAPLLAGSLQLIDSRYTRDVDLLDPETWTGGDRQLGGEQPGLQLFSLTEEPLASLRFDVAVDADEPLRVSSNVVQGGLRPALRLLGTGRVPELRGVVYVEPTTVSLPATKLRVTGGTVRFEPGAPFAPRLDLRAETRMRGYDLTVGVSGPFDAPELVVSSTPPLSTQDALLLIGTGQLSASAASSSGRAQTARLIAVYLAQDLGSALFGGGEPGENSLLERIQLVKGQDVADDGTDTIEASFRLSDEVFVERDSLLLVGEYDRFKEVNFGLKLLVRFW